MADLSTTYLGLKLKNPLIVGSSSLTEDKDAVLKCANAGAGAVVMKSIFEEQIEAETSVDTENAVYSQHGDAWAYVQNLTSQHNLEKYLSDVSDAKAAVDIPVIASINCDRVSGWVDFVSEIEKTGADAIELNIFLFDIDGEQDPREMERRTVDIVKSVKKHTSLPVAVKMSNMYTNLTQVITEVGSLADALVLFNRFRSADIDIESIKLKYAKPYSSPSEISVPLRWIGLTSDDVKCDFCGTTGVHSFNEAVKLLLAGAKTFQVCSALYLNNMGQIGEILNGLEHWMDEKNFKTIEDFRGKFANNDEETLKKYSRIQYMKYLHR